jgi:shikimate kinase
MNVILFGFKRSGKTYYGLKVAQKLHMHFVDSDHVLEKLYTKIHQEELSYRNIVKKHGFPFFHNLEKHVVSLLMHEKNSVISLGGGVVLDPENVARVKQIGTMVYLKTSKEELKHRILSSDPPAYIDPHHPNESFDKIYNERISIYESIPAHVLSTEHLSEEEIVDEICKILLEARGSSDGEQ